MAWKVRYVDYPQQFHNMEKEIMDTVHTVLSRGDLMMRQQLRDFEEHFADFVGTRYAVGVNNCTDALFLTLKALGVGAGDEVITVSHTFVATVEIIVHTGARPVLIDIGDDHCMNTDLIRAAITPRTKAIIPVHLNGRVCRMDTVMAIARQHNLLVVEDAAQGLGGSYRGTGAGAFGNAGCFSFYPAKLLGAFGDAGAIVTNDEQLAGLLRKLRDHGRGPDGDITVWGFNSRLDNIQAALLDLKLTRLPEWLKRRREIAVQYTAQLKALKQVHLPVPPAADGIHHDVFQNYEIEAEKRDELRAFLKEKGIETMLPWGGRGVHQFPALGLSHCALPRTEKMFCGALMLPMYPELTDEQVRYVCDAVKEWYGR